MSAFLGPIHYMLFKKIKFQDDFCEFLIDKIKLKNEDLYSNIRENTYEIPKFDLEEIIDLSNIHGSLQEMIGEIEYKLAYIVDNAEKTDTFSFEEILVFANEYGKIAIKEDVSNIDLIGAYNLITANLLNGMPCDRVQEILENTEEKIAWMDRMDIHAVFWNNFDRDSRDFYKIRREIILGMLENSNVIFEEVKNFEYSLRRR